ncbi:interleukin-5 [Marmota monax]|uniref:interleukin-5 n=1 Tax=Marmota flaviventris TaxID=93162 RepID=UPI000FFF8B66|nr:interleukin-5 [Marmota flaviventris]XP_058442499.1 interleukin-5 [Marmota monax]KAI6049416.1 IL5 [Marmota monax]KAI6059599.1 IL5 [Marmota monax]
MGMLLRLSLVALGAAYTCALALEIPMSTLVKETLTLLSTHQTVLIGNETLRIPVPAHKNHQLCIEEIFQGIDTLKNQTAQGDAVERLFQNLSLMKKYIDIQKKKCGQERRRVKQFLEYLQEFLGVINTEWMMES